MVILIIALVAIWILFFFNRGFHDWMNSADDGAIQMTHAQFEANERRELYRIWIGRILDIVSAFSGSGKKPLGREHYVSVLFWVLVIAGVSGYLLKILFPDFWVLFVMITLILSDLYAGSRAGRIPPDPGDLPPGNI